MAKYLYFVRMDVDQDKEERFNQWYNEVHLPALLKVPGVLGASRYISLAGSPKFTAIYELERPDIPSSEAWKNAVTATPRPIDIASKNVVRNICERIYP